MGLLIQKSGMLSTIQDLGRYGYRQFGINPNGVMDPAAARLVNLLLGNDENAAVLEMHYPAAQIELRDDHFFAVGGADLGGMLDDKPIDNWRPHRASKGSILRFTSRVSGARAYLAIAGGLELNPWLGSTSTNLAAKVGGLEGRALRTGDIIRTNPPTKDIADRRVSHNLIPHYSRFPTVRVTVGAEYHLLSEAAKQTLVEHDFVISNNSNRMGFRLEGEAIELVEPTELVSSAVNFGTIQLIPGGQLIVLMADQQTTGGYPRIAHVISHDLPLLAQLSAGDRVAFHLVGQEESERIAAAYERELCLFRVGCNFNYR
ncbi:MAG: biotin-dependent carboxyltransferase family protein [Acidobacteria bacterium]|nr:biotin-dependent carboxyltransferase family protein [Acidobacteriota bacterium]